MLQDAPSKSAAADFDINLLKSGTPDFSGAPQHEGRFHCGRIRLTSS
jgi:hypothetical protein